MGESDDHDDVDEIPPEAWGIYDSESAEMYDTRLSEEPLMFISFPQFQWEEIVKEEEKAEENIKKFIQEKCLPMMTELQALLMEIPFKGKKLKFNIVYYDTKT